MYEVSKVLFPSTFLQLPNSGILSGWTDKCVDQEKVSPQSVNKSNSNAEVHICMSKYNFLVTTQSFFSACS